MPQTSNINATIPVGPDQSDGLLLKVYSGETMKTYNRATVLKGRVRERTIKSGNTAQFAAIGKMSAEYHQPGQVILGQEGVTGEKIIVVDDLLISSFFTSNFQEAMNHFETRSEYSFQAGQSLAQAHDQRLFAIATKAAQNGDTGAVAGMGAATVDNIGAAPTTAAVVDAIYDAMTVFNETNIPMNDRSVIVTPQVYTDLIQDGSFLDRDFGNDSNGSQKNGSIMRVAGFDVIMSNNLNLNFGVDTLPGVRAGAAVNDYTVDGTNSVALVMQKSALGTVNLMSLATEKDYMVNRQGTLVVSRMACGHGVLRPEGLRLIQAQA